MTSYIIDLKIVNYLPLYPKQAFGAIAITLRSPDSPLFDRPCVNQLGDIVFTDAICAPANPVGKGA